jgi:hypothetical protein
MVGYRGDAIRRYLRRLAMLTAINLPTLCAAVMLFRANAVSGLPAYALALLPGLLVVGVFWAIWLGLGAVYNRFPTGAAGCA